MSSSINERISIPKFYENKSIFITGATGFIGRLLVEKLLRDCPGINKIYVLLRPKRGKPVHERIKDIIDVPIFDKLREDKNSPLDKLVAIAGNTEELNLGISDEDRKTIIENVTIMFHNAASVRFDDHLQKAILSNTRSAREVTMLARDLKHIDVFVDTSTAYCNCDRLIVEEKLYPAKVNWKDLIRIAEEGDQATLEVLTQKFIYPMPNTYTFTKALGEHAVVELSQGKIPAVIVRPTIVQPTFSEPLPGWVDNLNGSIGVMYGVGRGVTRCLLGEKNNGLDHVFADSVIKSLIISAWKKGISRDVDQVPILNLASDLNYSFKDLFTRGLEYRLNNPLSYYLWPPNPFMYRSANLFYFNIIFSHFIPALFVDLALILKKKKPMLYSIQRKAFLANINLLYFMQNSWTFKNKNYRILMNSILPEDRKLFTIDYFGPKPSSIYIDEYLQKFFNGMRTYIASEGPTTPELIRKQNRLFMVEKVWKSFWILLLAYYIVFEMKIISVITDGVYTYFDNIVI